MKTEFPKVMLCRMADCEEGYVYTELGGWNDDIEDLDPDITYTIIVNEHYDDGRWKSKHNLVFLDNSTGIHYYIDYERGLTESQHCSPFDYEDDMVECRPVKIHQEEVVVIKTTWDFI